MAFRAEIAKVTFFLTVWPLTAIKVHSVYSYNVTIFGEKSPNWDHFNSLWQFLEILLNSWQKFEPTLEHCYAIGRTFMVVNGQICNNNLDIWSQWLVTCNSSIGNLVGYL